MSRPLYEPTGICRKCRFRERCHEARQHAVDLTLRARGECPFFASHMSLEEEPVVRGDVHTQPGLGRP